VSAGQCCNGARTDGWAAMSYVAIPSNWDIYTRSYSSEGCNEKDLIGPIRSEGRTELCAGNNKHYKSGQYFFSNKKTRGVAVERDEVPQDCVKPDTLYFADNSAYHIADLTDAQIEGLVCFWFCSGIHRCFTDSPDSPRSPRTARLPMRFRRFIRRSRSNKRMFEIRHWREGRN
jgi:hypothetical protein